MGHEKTADMRVHLRDKEETVVEDMKQMRREDTRWNQ